MSMCTCSCIPARRICRPCGIGSRANHPCDAGRARRFACGLPASAKWDGGSGSATPRSATPSMRAGSWVRIAHQRHAIGHPRRPPHEDANNSIGATCALGTRPTPTLPNNWSRHARAAQAGLGFRKIYETGRTRWSPECADPYQYTRQLKIRDERRGWGQGRGSRNGRARHSLRRACGRGSPSTTATQLSAETCGS